LQRFDSTSDGDRTIRPQFENLVSDSIEETERLPKIRPLQIFKHHQRWPFLGKKLPHPAKDRVFVTLHIDFDQRHRKTGIAMLAQKLIERDALDHTRGSQATWSTGNNVPSHIDRSMALKADLTIGIGKSNLVNLETKLIPSKVLSRTRSCHRVRFKQNRIFYRIRQQKAH